MTLKNLWITEYAVYFYLLTLKGWRGGRDLPIATKPILLP